MVRGRRSYNTRTDADIKRAFLAVLAKKPLADITVIEVAREARVSRSTFYLHYDNLGNLYSSIVGDIANIVLPIDAILGCRFDSAEGKKPFCQLVREKGEYQPVFREPRFLETFFRCNDGVDRCSSAMERLMGRGLDPRLARAIFLFQISGCFAVSSMCNSNSDWEKIRRTIDRFI